MRILYIGSFRLPCYDAASARVLNVARALRLAGHEVSFISWGGEQRDEDYCEDNQYRFDGFPYIVTDEIDFKGGAFNKLVGWVKQGARTKALLYNRLGQYDVVIAYNCSLIRWLIPFCEKNSIKLVTDLTEWYEYNELKPIMWPGYAVDMFCYQKRIKNKIVISKYLDRYYQSSHNIIVPATCDASEEKWRQGKGKAEEKAGLFDGITLIYAGNPARKDAVHYAIGAVQRLVSEGVNIRFLIIGITRENYIERYHSLLSNRKLTDKIQFLDRIPQEDVPAYYALADFMVLLRESTRKSNAGFPTKFAESFTSGTPVIANLTSDLGEFLIDEETGFVVPEPNVDSIYYVLKEKVLSLNQSHLEILKNNVRNTANQLDYHAFVEPLQKFIFNLK